ncbi:MAG: hypothetical protein AAGG38_15030 [Planctomycetota bacterium]
MPLLLIFWNDIVLEKIAEHGLTQSEVEAVVYAAREDDEQASRSTGRPLYLGDTPDGLTVVVVFEWIEHGASIRIVTAYPKD